VSGIWVVVSRPALSPVAPNLVHSCDSKEDRAMSRSSSGSGRSDGRSFTSDNRATIIASALGAAATVAVGTLMYFKPAPAPAPAPTPPDAKSVDLQGQSNTRLLEIASESYMSIPTKNSEQFADYLREIIARFFDRSSRQPLCVNDESLWGSPQSPKAIWSAIFPFLRQHLATQGLWPLPPIPTAISRPHECS
jgi:hypothetical protein